MNDQPRTADAVPPVKGDENMYRLLRNVAGQAIHNLRIAQQTGMCHENSWNTMTAEERRIANQDLVHLEARWTKR